MLMSPQARIQRISHENAQEDQKFICLCVFCAFSRLFLWPHCNLCIGLGSNPRHHVRLSGRGWLARRERLNRASRTIAAGWRS
jgi:hypothetical protein